MWDSPITFYNPNLKDIKSLKKHKATCAKNRRKRKNKKK